MFRFVSLGLSKTRKYETLEIIVFGQILTFEVLDLKT